MIILKNREEIELMRESALSVSRTLGIIAKEIKPGVTTLHLDKIAEEMIQEIESKLSDDIGGILDPYDGRELDNNKLTAMIWYVGDQIASC